MRTSGEHVAHQIVSWNFGDFGYQFYGTEGFVFMDVADPGAFAGRYYVRGHIAYTTAKPKKGVPNELELSTKPKISNLRQSTDEPPKWKFVITPDYQYNDDDDEIYRTLTTYPFHQPDMQGIHQQFLSNTDQWVGSQWTQSHPLYGLGMVSANLTQNFYQVDIAYDVPYITYSAAGHGHKYQPQTDNPWQRSTRITIDHEIYGRRVFVIGVDTNSRFYAFPTSTTEKEEIDKIYYQVDGKMLWYFYNIQHKYVKSVDCPWPDWVNKDRIGWELPFVMDEGPNDPLRKLKPNWMFSPNGKYGACIAAKRDIYPFSSPTIIAEERKLGEGRLYEMRYDATGMVEVEFVITLTGYEKEQFEFEVKPKQSVNSLDENFHPIAVGYALRDMKPGDDDPLDVKQGEGDIKEGELLMMVMKHTIEKNSIITDRYSLPENQWDELTTAELPTYQYDYLYRQEATSFVTIRHQKETGWEDRETYLVYGHWRRYIEYDPEQLLEFKYIRTSDKHRYSTIGEQYGITVDNEFQYIEREDFMVIGHLMHIDLSSYSFTFGYSGFAYSVKRDGDPLSVRLPNAITDLDYLKQRLEFLLEQPIEERDEDEIELTMSLIESQKYYIEQLRSMESQGLDFGQSLGVQAAYVVPYVWGTKRDELQVGHTLLKDELKTIHENPNNYGCDTLLVPDAKINISYDFNGHKTYGTNNNYYKEDARRIELVRFNFKSDDTEIDCFPTLMAQHRMESRSQGSPPTVYSESGVFPSSYRSIHIPEFYSNYSQLYNLIVPGMNYTRFIERDGEIFLEYIRKDDSINDFPCGKAYHIRIQNLVMSAMANRCGMTKIHKNGSFAYFIGPVAALAQPMNIGKTDANTYDQGILDKIMFRQEYNDKERKGRTKATGESTHLDEINKAFNLSLIKEYYYFNIQIQNEQFAFKLNMKHQFVENEWFSFMPSIVPCGNYCFDPSKTHKHFLFPLAPGWSAYYWWDITRQVYIITSCFGLEYMQYKPIPTWPRHTIFPNPAMEGLFS